MYVDISSGIGSADFTDVTFDGNQADVINGAGGGLLVFGGGFIGGGLPVHAADAGEVTMNRVTVSNNEAVSGGGLYVDSAPVSLTNSTIAGNTASSEGGGIYVYTAALDLTHVTIAYNGTTRGTTGGIYVTTDDVSNSTLNLTNTLLARNTNSDHLPANCGGGSSDQTLTGTNMADDNSCGDNPPAMTVVTDAMIDSLHNYGGTDLTETVPLLAGSPAIDAIQTTDGIAACPATDQRGTTRPQGLYCDVGAFEVPTRDADIGVTKTDSPDPVDAGNNITYTITLTNHGPDRADDSELDR